MVNKREFLKLCAERLALAGLPEPKIDSELIFCHVLGIKRGKLSLIESLTKKQARQINKLIKKRLKHIPVQYLLGDVEFLNLKLKVNKSVLIPRNETEQLTEIVINYINSIKGQKKQFLVLDMCSGSGAVGLGVAKNTNSLVDLCDISKNALKVGRHNAKINNVKNVRFIKSNLFKNITKKYDLFVSNPPYVETQVIKTLQKQVKDFEPRLALDGGQDGMKFYKKIIRELPKFLNPDASAFFEVGKGQHKQVVKLLKEAGFKNIEVIKDYCEVDRMIRCNF